MRRSFRLATVFTGVAALAGGYGPTALGATTPTTTIRPDIANQVCGANNGGISNWVHLYYPADDHPAECFHGAGPANVNATIASFCPGNNNGTYNLAGYPTLTFEHSSGRNKFSVPVHMSHIDIRSWTGDAKCT